MSEDFFAAIKSGDVERVRLILHNVPQSCNAKSEDGTSAIVTAMYSNQPEIAEMLVAKGADLDFFEAAMVGKTDLVKKAIEEDPNIVNSFSRDGFTSLHFAAFFGARETLELLLSKGADVNAVAKNPTNVMPIHSAVSQRHLEITKLLLNNGANVSAKQQGGFTPLHEAAQSGSLDLVMLLVERGASINDRNDKGATPLALARIPSRENENGAAIVEFLMSRGAIG